MLKEEETLQIDTLSKCVDIQEECVPQFQHQFIQDSSYSNMSNNGCSSSLLGIPYAVSTMDSSTALGTSLNSLNISLQFGSPAEDSGCCFCSHMSLERDPPLYCNEYCTLNAFHQSCPVTAENHGSLWTKFCLKGMTRADAVTKVWTVSQPCPEILCIYIHISIYISIFIKGLAQDLNTNLHRQNWIFKTRWFKVNSLLL